MSYLRKTSEFPESVAWPYPYLTVSMRDQLNLIHEALIDPDSPFLRLAPGVTPGHDLSALNLHAVRETALAAYADFAAGNSERARTALRAVVDAQWLEPGAPWHGTFPTVAEQPAPGEGAVEWTGFDPNWRQFVGVVLARCRLEYTSLLGDKLVASVDAALRACVEGEPRERIPEWYTNPLLLAAWLEATVGVMLDEPAFVTRGEERLRSVNDQVERDGDLAEYNSPTYDGVDLFALALCEGRPPTPYFADAGSRLRQVVEDRLNRLWHREFQVITGPYIRSYGFRLTDYVSLTGLWLAMSGVDHGTLPKILDVDTDHIHDLFFAPLFEGLTRPWNLPRWEGGPFHTQRFESTVATSCPVSFAATGVEVGRRHTFARDQYFPLVAHKSRGDSVDYLALQVPASVTVTEGSIGYDARIFATLTSDGPRVTCVLRTSERPRWQRAELACGSLSLWCSKEPDLMEITELPLGFSTRLEWDVPVLPVQVVPQSYF